MKRALITHAHGDHARPGSAAYLCAEGTAALLRRRFGSDAPVETTPCGTALTIGEVRVSFHPAGHVLGSAQIRIEGAAGVWVVSGDYKRAADPTCAPFEPVRCDTFVTESTFGLPIYRWDSTASVIRDIFAWWQANAAEQRSSVLFCYTIGKAQRLLAELAALTDRRVFVHGMMLPMIEAYREAGVACCRWSPPPSSRAARRSPASSCSRRCRRAARPGCAGWAPHSDAFASGLMRVRGVRRQRAFDRGFVLSDHADWPALLQTIEETGAARVLATHGHAEPLARYLARAGTRCGSDSDGVGGGADGGD